MPSAYRCPGQVLHNSSSPPQWRHAQTGLVD